MVKLKRGYTYYVSLDQIANDLNASHKEALRVLKETKRRGYIKLKHYPSTKGDFYEIEETQLFSDICCLSDYLENLEDRPIISHKIRIIKRFFYRAFQWFYKLFLITMGRC